MNTRTTGTERGSTGGGADPRAMFHVERFCPVRVAPSPLVSPVSLSLKPCSRCRGRRDRPGQTFCRRCHREYMRERRRAGLEPPLTPEQQARQRSRSLLNMAIDRGDIVRGACELAGDDCHGRIEGHHDDYDLPLDVRWLCVAHHKAHHASRSAATPSGQRAAAT